MGVILVLIIFELVLRGVEDSLSEDVANIERFPLVSEKINASPDTYHIVFLGNSLTANAVGPRVIENVINDEMGADTGTVFAVTPDGTSISDWYCLYTNLFEDLSNPPDYIYIGFAWNLLTDQHPVNAARLGGRFCQFSDIDGLSSTQLAHHNQILEFTAGSLSHIYVSREAIRNRILSIFIPKYKRMTQSLNVNVAAAPMPNIRQPVTETYKTLQQLIERMKVRGTRVVLMAMPVVAPYEVDQNLISMLDELGAGYIDLRHAQGIQRHMFLDSMHLDKEGRKVFSALLGEDVAGRLLQGISARVEERQ